MPFPARGVEVELDLWLLPANTVPRSETLAALEVALPRAERAGWPVVPATTFGQIIGPSVSAVGQDALDRIRAQRIAALIVPVGELVMFSIVRVEERTEAHKPGAELGVRILAVPTVVAWPTTWAAGVAGVAHQPEGRNGTAVSEMMPMVPANDRSAPDLCDLSAERDSLLGVKTLTEDGGAYQGSKKQGGTVSLIRVSLGLGSASAVGDVTLPQRKLGS